MILKTLNDFINSKRHRERAGMLALGCLIIYCFWYFVFEKTLAMQISLLTNGLTAVQYERNRLEATNQRLSGIMKTAIENNEAAQEKLLAVKPVTLFVTDNASLLKAIIQVADQVNVSGFKNIPPDHSQFPGKAYGAQIEFNSDFYSTVAYLDRLEKLPWCLSWDSLQYSVTSYPKANVVLNLFVSNQS